LNRNRGISHQFFSLTLVNRLRIDFGSGRDALATALCIDFMLGGRSGIHDALLGVACV